VEASDVGVSDTPVNVGVDKPVEEIILFIYEISQYRLKKFILSCAYTQTYRYTQKRKVVGV